MVEARSVNVKKTTTMWCMVCLLGTFVRGVRDFTAVQHSTTILRFLALLRLSFALPDPIFVPVPISATVLASVPVVCVFVYQIPHK